MSGRTCWPARCERPGQPSTPPAQRLAQVEQTIDELRAEDGDGHTPVLIAAGGPKARALAAAKADIFTLATGPLAARDEVARLAEKVRGAAGDRAAALEFAITIFVVGDEAPAWVQRFTGADAGTLIAHDSLAILRGSAREMADELQRRRDMLGCSYIIVNGTFIEQFAAVVELLAGR